MTEEEKAELKELQEAHSQVGRMRQQLLDWKRDYTRTVVLCNAMQGILGKRINDIKGRPDEIITDHAILRYFERFKGADLDEIREAIRDLPDEYKRIESNNVLTVFPAPKVSNVGGDGGADS